MKLYSTKLIQRGGSEFIVTPEDCPEGGSRTFPYTFPMVWSTTGCVVSDGI